MDSKTYIADAIRTESVPARLNVNELALHATLELTTAVARIADQFKRRLYYATPEKDVRLDTTKMMSDLMLAANMVNWLGQSLDRGLDMNDRMDSATLAEATRELPEGVRDFQLDKLSVRLLHAALGCFTESGELLESMKKQYETGMLDKTNFGEEVGDIEWYQAIGFDESGVAESSCREKNIAKLRKRYPNKFSSEAAVNRDLTAERTVLETTGVSA